MPGFQVYMSWLVAMPYVNHEDKRYGRLVPAPPGAWKMILLSPVRCGRFREEAKAT
jgi:hypothetical protein